MDHKTLQEYLEEQRELYKNYTAPKDRELIAIFADKIRGLMESDNNN